MLKGTKKYTIHKLHFLHNKFRNDEICRSLYCSTHHNVLKFFFSMSVCLIRSQAA